MSNLKYLFYVGQKVKCVLDECTFSGTVTQTEPDYITVNIPEVSDHCRFEEGINMDCVYPDYNF